MKRRHEALAFFSRACFSTLIFTVLCIGLVIAIILDHLGVSAAYHYFAEGVFVLAILFAVDQLIIKSIIWPLYLSNCRNVNSRNINAVKAKK